MADKKAESVVRLWKSERAKQQNSLNLWQETGDHIYPYVKLTTTYQDGTPRTNAQYDMTPMLDMYDMVAYLKHILFPMGQPFMAIKARGLGGGRMSDTGQRYLSQLTEDVHEAIYESNYVTEFDEVLLSLINFGPACCATTWTKKDGLQFRASEIGSYVLIEDSYKNVIGSVNRLCLTAAQAYEIFGASAGKEVIKALETPEHENDIFEFLHKCTPRERFNSNLPSQHPDNSPYESVYVNVKENSTVSEGGMPENVYQYARWRRPGTEKDGRGVSTEILPQVRVLFQVMKALIECGEKHNNPPREILDSFEGVYNTFAGGANYVRELPSSRALESAMLGNFPIDVKVLELLQAICDRAYCKNAFAPLEGLPGDRRTTLEIRERIRSALPKIGPPINRLWSEMVSKQIERTTLLLIRNRQVAMPPEELAGMRFGVQFVGPFALALQSAQAQASQEYMQIIGAMSPVFPDIIDNVDADDMAQRIGRTLGVNVEDMASEEERNAKRQKRAEEIQQQKMAMAAQVGSEAYRNTKDAPAEGSPAQALMQGAQ